MGRLLGHADEDVPEAREALVDALRLAQRRPGRLLALEDGRWLAESSASFGADYAFPASPTFTASYLMTPGIPLNMLDRKSVV